jgi:hypothetical protein
MTNFGTHNVASCDAHREHLPKRESGNLNKRPHWKKTK